MKKCISGRIVLLFLFIAISFIDSNAQIITTFAGNGTSGTHGDGGAARSAQLCAPYGVAIDRHGNIYIADWCGHSVRKVNTYGVITTVAGNDTAGFSGDDGLAINAQLNTPTGVSVDTAGNLYIADQQNNRIRKVSTTGIISTIAGTNVRGYNGDDMAATMAQLSLPTGVFADKKGNVFIADYGNGRIRKINAAGTIISVAGYGPQGFSGDGGVATLAELDYPSGVITDAIGNIFVADQSNNRIRKIDTVGIISTFAGTGSWGVSSGGYSGDGGQAAAAEMHGPTGLTLDGSGNMYIADQGNNAISKINANGVISTIAGTGVKGFNGDEGAATISELYSPDGVAVDDTGNVYVADWGNSRLRMITNKTSAVGAVMAPANGIRLFPNPATGELSIHADEQIESILISSIVGQPVISQIVGASSTRIDISSLPGGIYILTVNGSAVSKFVKK